MGCGLTNWFHEQPRNKMNNMLFYQIVPLFSKYKCILLVYQIAHIFYKYKCI